MTDRVPRRRTVRSLAATLCLLALAAAVPAAAQQGGTLRGKVTTAGGSRPLPGAQVSVAGTGLGALTSSTGDFVIENVPAGRRTVRVDMLGFGSLERTVMVAAGTVTEARFELSEQAIALDQVIVTGTVGGTQRRALGTVVDRISAAAAVRTAPATSVNQLLAARSPGVQVLGGAGTVGAGSPIHIRGVSSMSLDATPLIYIDGVRMDSRLSGPPGIRGGGRQSRLDDINLEDIESIEVIKGPAAATLYGTEASNGVIQIVTKRGAEGPTQFDMAMRMGKNWLWNPEAKTGWSYTGGLGGAPLDSVNLYAHERDFGPWGDPFKYGHLEALDLNVRGGAERLRYYVSGGYSNEVGVVPYNWQKQFSVRSNVDAILAPPLTAKFNLAYITRSYRAAQQNDPVDAFGNLVWGSPANLNTKWRGFQAAPPEISAQIDSREEVGRSIASAELRYQPLGWLISRVVAGIDAGEEENAVLYPRDPDGSAGWWGSLSLGSKNVTRQNNTIVTVDFSSSASKQLGQDLKATTSAGFQYYHLGSKTLGAIGTQFAASPLTTVSAGALTTGSESFVENATVGLFVQQQLDWRNRVFLTAAVRGDDNSAFGAQYEAAVYPKLSAAWVVHEEPFWKVDWVSKFRLRGAWGAAGRQPATLAAVQLYAPVTGFGDQPGLAPSAIGNEALKPERSEELELGFDLGLLKDRVEVVFTHYNRVVKDAMIGQPLPPSSGFSGTQIVNLGRVKGWGNEVQVNARMLDGRRIGWDMGVGFSTTANRIEALGAGRSVLGSGFSQNIVGFSIADLYWQKVLSAEFVNGTSGAVKNIMCDGGTGPSGREMGGPPVPCANAPLVRWGHSQPTWQVNLTQGLDLGQRVRLFLSVDGSGGNWQQDSSDPANHTTYCSSRACRVQDDPIVMAYRAIGRNPLGMYEAGFLKLREASATYTLPSAWAQRFGARGGSVSLAGRNLMTLWTAQMGWDTPRDGRVIVPLGNGRVWDVETRGTGDLSTGYQTVMPPLASTVLTVRMSF
ncbi:MAG TPA: TonB-dependent receptor [Longimicrobiales bacterium]|nr:TonB-dependent receptor [Longimicrobiales bacterium]